MKTLLYLSSSLNGEAGESSKLAQYYLSTLENNGQNIELIQRELNSQPIPHLNANSFTGFQLAETERNQEQQAAAALSEQLIDELRRADELVIAMPLYNLGIPSTFKAWIDHVARAGHTFQYTSNGPQGLLKDKPVTIVAARGGSYANTPLDTQSEYLRHIFALMGLHDLRFIYAENLARGGDMAEQSRQDARQQIEQQVA